MINTIRQKFLKSQFANRRFVTVLVFRTYDIFNKIRFFRRWEDPVTFFESTFVIGRDESLLPSVASGHFEAEEINWLLETVADNAVIWDVGANVGIYSVLLAKNKPNRSILAFEPVPQTLSRLEDNLRRNNASNVKVFPFALGSQNLSLPMHVSISSPGGNSLVSAAPRSQSQIIEVEVRRADDLVAEGLPLPDVIKIDIEGYEPSFFEGAQQLLHSRPMILLEFNPFGKVEEDGSIEARWFELLSNLFNLYGGALLFDTGTQRPISGLSDLELDGFPRPINLAFKRNT